MNTGITPWYEPPSSQRYCERCQQYPVPITAPAYVYLDQQTLARIETGLAEILALLQALEAKVARMGDRISGNA